MLGGNAPALDSNGLPVADLVAKFADITGTREMGERLVLAAAILVTKTKAISNPTIDDVERILFSALSEPVPNIVNHPKSALFRQFVIDDSKMSDSDVGKTIDFLVKHVADKMKGAAAELLSFVLLFDLVEAWRRLGRLPETARLIPGSAIQMRKRGKSAGWYKGADGLIVTLPDNEAGPIEIYGIVEIKSKQPLLHKSMDQLKRHQARLARGLNLEGRVCPPDRLVFVTREGRGWKKWAVDKPPADLPIVLVFGQGKHLIKRRKKLAHLKEVPIDTPYEDLTACGLSLVSWVVERLGDRFLRPEESPDSEEMSADEKALNGYRQALYFATQRQLSAEARGNVEILFNFHFAQYGFAAPHV